MNTKNSFTYIISSDDRTNTGANPSFYDINFGGFTEHYENYVVDVVFLGTSTGLPLTSNYYYFVAENLCNDRYLSTTKLSNKQAILSILPLNAVQDAYIQSDGGNISFKLINARVRKRVRFRFVKQDFTDVVSGTDVNVGAGAETKWVLALRLTPIEDL